MTKVQEEKYINKLQSHIPKNKRGFTSKFEPGMIIRCILHKLKTGCQWSRLFIDIEGFKPIFSYQTVYYYFNKWSKLGIFEEVFREVRKEEKGQLKLEILNLDGTQSLSKKGVKR